MIRVSASRTVAASPQRAWDLYADVPGSVAWVPFVEEVLWVSGPAGLGQRYRERTRLLGSTGEQEWEIVEWEPPRRQVQCSDAFRTETRLIIEIRAQGTGCRIRQASEIRSFLPRPIAWAHEAAMAAVARYGVGLAVAAAKAHLEGASAGGNGTDGASPPVA